jgi:predicted nuclease with TOPRIM domain
MSTKPNEDTLLAELFHSIQLQKHVIKEQHDNNNKLLDEIEELQILNISLERELQLKAFGENALLERIQELEDENSALLTKIKLLTGSHSDLHNATYGPTRGQIKRQKQDWREVA